MFVLQLVAFGVQAYYMRGALNAAEDGVIEARKALEASERHASAERESAERSAVAANEATARSLAISDRNANAARDAAIEAQRAGARVERLERPWLILCIVQTNADEMLRAARSDDPHAFPFIVTVEWELANHGRTPAWIVHSSMPQIHFVGLPYEKNPPHHFEGNYDNTPVTTATPLHATDNRSVSREEHDAILNGEAALVFSGSVYYRDIFTDADSESGERHETHFSFTCERTILSDGLVIIGHFIIGGPREWTKYT